jgi:peroxiredoxin
LVEHRREFENRESVWVINPQDVAATKRFKEKSGAPFVFLCDENLDVVNRYGVYHMKHEEHGYIPFPVTFVIKPDGTIAWRYLGLKPRDRPEVADILDAIDHITLGSSPK